MNEQTLERLFSQKGVMVAGSHVVYTSGKHGRDYFNKDAIYPYTLETSFLCRIMAERFGDEGVEVVAGPAVGGIILQHLVAGHLTKIREADVLSVYAEKEVVLIPPMEGDDRDWFAETGRFIFKRGYDKLIRGKRVLVVEDVLTTGGSVKKVVEAVREAGGEVVGVCALCNRGGVTYKDVGVPRLCSLVNITMDAWDEADCPLCMRGVPVNTDVGKGREFFARMKRS